MDQNIKEIITRVLEGNASQNDREVIIEWLKLNEENRHQLEQIEGIWNALEILANQQEFNHEKGYKDFSKTLHKKEISQQLVRQNKSFKYLLPIAASLMLILGFQYFLWVVKHDKVEEITYFELNTPKGSHTFLTLIDGSTVWLNAGSKLRYPNKFDGKTRIIYLDGEAFFNVKKDPEHPFVVQTSDVNVKALGTSFNVKAYAKEGSIETTLIEGTVLVEGNSIKKKFTPVRLSPNQRVTFVKKSGKLLLNDKETKLLVKEEEYTDLKERKKESLIVTEDVNTELYTSWIENQLLFENETFESIAYKLERRYGATLLFKNDKIKSYRFSGKFPEISIEGVLNALQFASPFKYDIKKDTILIN